MIPLGRCCFLGDPISKECHITLTKETGNLRFVEFGPNWSLRLNFPSELPTQKKTDLWVMRKVCKKREEQKTRLPQKKEGNQPKNIYRNLIWQSESWRQPSNLFCWHVWPLPTWEYLVLHQGRHRPLALHHHHHRHQWCQWQSLVHICQWHQEDGSLGYG